MPPNAHWHYYCRNLSALPEVARARDALGVSGAAMAVRTQWFLESGGFDESYVNGFEDVNLCMRARAQERTIAYVPEARFVHYEAASVGRFDREAANERLFYDRWASAMSALPRTRAAKSGRSPSAMAPRTRCCTRRCEISKARFAPSDIRSSAAASHRGSASTAAFERRQRSGGFATPRPHRRSRSHATGAPSRRSAPAARSRSTGRGCRARQRNASRRAASAHRRIRRALRSELGSISPAIERELGARAVRVTPEMLLGNALPVNVACLVHAGWTDAAAFGSVLLVQAGIPAVALDCAEVRAIVAADTALFAEEGSLREAIARFTGDVELQRRYGRVIAADSRRRFSPRRSAIRVIDLLCAARFGLERPAGARRDAPF